MPPNTLGTGSSVLLPWLALSQTTIQIFLEAETNSMGMSLSSSLAGVPKHPCVGEGNPPLGNTGPTARKPPEGPSPRHAP